MDWLKAALDASDDEDSEGGEDVADGPPGMNVHNDGQDGMRSMERIVATDTSIPLKEEVVGPARAPGEAPGPPKEPEHSRKKSLPKREFNANRDFNIDRVFKAIRGGLRDVSSPPECEVEDGMATIREPLNSRGDRNSEGPISSSRDVHATERPTGAPEGFLGAHEATHSVYDDHYGHHYDHSDHHASASPSHSIDLFTIESRSRNPETFRVDDLVKINVETCTEDEILGANAAQRESQNVHGTPPEHVRPILDTLDYSKVLGSFNASNSEIKLPKEWQGTDIHITDIKADDLRMSKEEKERVFSGTKEALMEGRKKYSIMAHRMETDDGHILTSNTVRRTQKRKHQINWLAAEAQDKELEIMERTAHMRKSKHEARMKYGW